jgi:alkane 1-monooxygenase
MAAPTQPNESTEIYRDRWRWVWLLSLLSPALVATGPLLMWWTGDAVSLWWPLVFLYGLVPLADWWIPPSRRNPPESAVSQLENDAYYRHITYALVPVLWAAFVFAAWFVASHDLPWHAWIAMVLNAGAVGGVASTKWSPWPVGPLRLAATSPSDGTTAPRGAHRAHTAHGSANNGWA